MTKFSFGLLHLYSLSLLHMLQLKYCSQSDLTHRRDCFFTTNAGTEGLHILLFSACFASCASLHWITEGNWEVKEAEEAPEYSYSEKQWCISRRAEAESLGPSSYPSSEKSVLSTGKQEEKSPRLLKCSRPSLTHSKKRRVIINQILKSTRSLRPALVAWIEEANTVFCHLDSA